MSSQNGNESPAHVKALPARPPRRQVTLLAILTVVLFVVVPFLFWRGTWFGRSLSEKDLGQQLVNDKKPREIQHALSQIADRISRRDPSAKAWYPQIAGMVNHKIPEVRVNAAWVMGQDNQSAEFHSALSKLLNDEEPLVRRNAALSLVRFGDASGKHEILGMIRPYTIRAPVDGVLSYRLEVGDPANVGTYLARIDAGLGEPFELRSPLPGHLRKKLVPEGAQLKRGDEVALLSPGADHVWEALRALYLIGQPEDLADIEPFASTDSAFSDRIRRQAQLTAQAIRGRADPSLQNQN